MKYYSEKLDELFDSEEACLKKEQEHDEQASRKKELTEKYREETLTAYKELVEARKKFRDAWNKFSEVCSDGIIFKF